MTRICADFTTWNLLFSLKYLLVYLAAPGREVVAHRIFDSVVAGGIFSCGMQDLSCGMHDLVP